MTNCYGILTVNYVLETIYSIHDVIKMGLNPSDSDTKDKYEGIQKWLLGILTSICSTVYNGKMCSPFRQNEVVKSDAPSPLLTFKRTLAITLLNIRDWHVTLYNTSAAVSETSSFTCQSIVTPSLYQQ